MKVNSPDGFHVFIWRLTTCRSWKELLGNQCDFTFPIQRVLLHLRFANVSPNAGIDAVHLPAVLGKNDQTQHDLAAGFVGRGIGDTLKYWFGQNSRRTVKSSFVAAIALWCTVGILF